MNDSLTLVLCIAFALVLLRLEWRAAPSNSWAVWIPTAWMLIAASRPLIQWFSPLGPGGGTLENDSGSTLDRWNLIVLALMAIAVLAYRRTPLWRCLSHLKWLLLVLAYMLLSCLWSDITLIAMKRWTREMIVPIVAMVMLSEANPLQALEAIFRRTAYVLLPFSIVLIKYYPKLGVEYGRYSGAQMWVGVTEQKNQLGRLCAISAMFLGFALYRYWRKRQELRKVRLQAWTDAGILLLALYLLKGSDSSTALVSLFLGGFAFTVICLFRRLRFTVPKSGLFVAAIILIVFGVATPFLGGTDVASFTQTLGRDQTLTGRTEVWADVLPARAERPLLGYGLGSFWTDARRKTYDIPSAHNGYLDILLELGEIGLVTYVVWLLSCAGLLHRSLANDYDWAGLSISFFLMGLVYSTAESALNSLTEHMTAVTVFTAVIMAQGAIPMKNRAKSITPLADNWEAWGAKFRPWPAAVGKVKAMEHGVNGIQALSQQTLHEKADARRKSAAEESCRWTANL